MTKAHINTFSKGMDKDTTLPKYVNTKYENANDLRLFTGDGLTTGAMVNIKGTDTLIDLPVLMKLSLNNPAINLNFSPGNITITAENGNTYTNTFTFSSTFEEFAEKLSAEGAFKAATPFTIPSNSAVPLSLVVHDTENNGIFVYSNEIQIAVWNDNSNSSQNLITADIYDSPIIIGDTTLRDDLILFTTENSSDIGGFGQIWKVAYDDATLKTTTGLIYAGDLNFTMEHLIEAVARYETPAIQRLHWTDNFNVLRSIEITNPNRFTIPVGKIASTPSLILSMPRIEQIIDGALFAGTYQIAYRLTSENGKTTELSPWSTPVNINNMPENVDMLEYGRTKDFSLLDYDDDFEQKYIAEKGLTAIIDNIYPGYEFMEVFALKRGQNTGVITSIDTYPITGFTSKSITYLGSEDSNRTVSARSLINSNVNFERVKTLTIKDNRLLVGNIKEFQIPEIDTKVFRYNVSQGTYTNNNPYTPNPYNRDKTITNSDELYQWQLNPSGTINENNKILGGTGENISYKFVTRDLQLDQNSIQVNSAGNIAYPVISPGSANYASLDINGVDYYKGVNPLKQNYQNPYIENRLAGYQRSEVYRFGIVFYSLTGRASDVKWIGDIRMPEDSDSDSENTGDPTGGFGEAGFSTFHSQSGKLKARALGLEFTVDVSKIKNNISGFSIVRSPRTNKDKTILGQGLLHDTVYSKINKDQYPSEDYLSNDGIRNVDRIDVNYNDPELTGSLSGINQLIAEQRDPSNSRNTDPPDSPMKEGLPTSNKLFTFDSPQLMSAVGDVNDYGPVISNSGISSRFLGKELSLRPVRRSGNPIKANLENEIACQLNIFNDDFDVTQIPDAQDNIYDKYSIISRRSFIKYYPGTAGSYTYNNISDLTQSTDNKIPFSSASKVNSGEAVDLATFAPGNSLSGDYYNTHHAKVTHSCPTILVYGDENLEELYNKSVNLTNNQINVNKTNYLADDQLGKITANIYYDNDEAYGGTNQSDIETSKYISVGHFQAVDPNDTETTYIAEVYGGDTYLNLVPIVKTFSLIQDPENEAGMGIDPKEWNEASLGDLAYKNSSEPRHWAGYYVPLESTENVDVRLMQGWDGPQYRVIQNLNVLFPGTTNYLNLTDITNTTSYGERIDPWVSKTSKLQDPIGNEWGSGLTPSSYASPEYYLPNIRNSTTDVVNYQSEDFSKTYYPISSDLPRISEFDNRIYASEVKINGEFSDSWGNFKAVNYLDVDGHQGPLNKLEVLNENVIFLQDKGFGVVGVNPRSVITGADGVTIELGTGDVLHDYNYSSTEIGTRHQFGTIKTPRGFYFFDSNSRKFYRFTGKAEPLSDLKSMSAYFYNELSGPVLNSDNPVIRSGINCGFDPRYNEILFTYHDGNKGVSSIAKTMFTKVGPIVNGVSTTSTYTFDIDDITAGKLLSGAKLYIQDFSDVIAGPTVVGSAPSDPLDGYILANVLSVLPIFPVPTSGPTRRVTLTVILPVFNAGEPLERDLNYKIESFIPEREATVVYSENIDSFAGFYSFTPKSYINDSARYFSPSPDSPRELHVHNEGERGVFYDRDPSVSSIRLIVNPKGDFTKVFNTIEYLGQMKDTNGNDIVNETFDTIRVYNEYQDTGEVPLVDLENIRRRMRTWRTNIPRSGTEFARIRNPYTTIELSFTNNLNKEIITNDIITYYLDIPM